MHRSNLSHNGKTLVSLDAGTIARFIADDGNQSRKFDCDIAEHEFLRTLGVTKRQRRKIAVCAALNCTDYVDELIASTLVGEEAYYRQLAVSLGLPFETNVDADRLLISDKEIHTQLCSHHGTRIVFRQEVDGQSSILVAPRSVQRSLLTKHLSHNPQIRSRLVVTTPTALRQALICRGRENIIDVAVNGLSKTQPQLSAKTVAVAWQGATIGALIVALPVFTIRFPAQTALAAHAFFSLFFLSCVYLRLAAASLKSKYRYALLKSVDPASYPVYSVLVPLYRESEVVPELVAALDKIVWPRSKLEIKIICEADDEATLSALAAVPLKPWVEVVAVPACLPRTKPKALNFAAQLISGDFIAVYDAEDRPHPYQMVEAWQRFHGECANLACLQAPLVVTNIMQSGIARMFGFEYAALFRGILPWLAKKNLVLPLGGTSNHFRKSSLQNIGYWDPYNVTEDADIGLRLCRAGYRVSTITRPTYEDGPAQLDTWIKQRTRWFKGWLQTWLVHNRSPLLLMRQLGIGSFIMSQILFAGLLVSALAHPLLLYTVIDLTVKILSGSLENSIEATLLIVDTTNIALGYGAFLMLGYRSLITAERHRFHGVILATPLYWMAMSIAAWRAVHQLVRKPFYWEKTPHVARKVPKMDN